MILSKSNSNMINTPLPIAAFYTDIMTSNVQPGNRRPVLRGNFCKNAPYSLTPYRTPGVLDLHWQMCAAKDAV